MNILDNVDFILPVYIEHPDRLRNLNMVIKYLKAIGAKNIFINEHYMEEPKVNTLTSNYISKNITGDKFFNKMVCGNELFNKFSTNKIVCLYDVDVLVTKKDLIECATKLLDIYEFAYPFCGSFYDIPINIVNKLQQDFTTGIEIKDCTLFSHQSHGGCVLFKQEVFIEGGKLNPNFKNVGYDDDEINVRYSRLGYKKLRTASPLLHLTHFRGKTSFNHNEFNNHNCQECHNITYMPIEELKQYIKTWYKND